MSQFTGHLGLILYEDPSGRAILSGPRTQWFVSPPLSYEVGAEGSGEVITVPGIDPTGYSELDVLGLLGAKRAFISDLGSTPQIAWSLGFSPSGPEAKAFVLHDWGCANEGFEIGHRYNPDGTLTPVSYSCQQVHDLLLEAMLVVGADDAKAREIHEAVLLFGPKW